MTEVRVGSQVGAPHSAGVLDAAPTASGTAAVAVLTWRGYELTRACLQSLTTCAGWPLPVLVVDNASGTGEGERLADEFGSPVSAVVLDRNVGVAGGYNAAMSWARAHDASQVLLLNNDTIVSDPHLVERLLAAAGKGIAAVGPLVKRADGSLQSAGGMVDWPTGRALSLGPMDIPSGDAPYPVAWVDGSCMLVSLEAAARVGGFADEYFMFWEEVDWCVRARRAGYRCLVEPRTSITHIGSVTVGSDAALRRSLRNKILFMRRNAGRADNASALLTFVALVIPNQMLRQGLRPKRWLVVLRAAIDALCWNGADALRRRAWLIPPREAPPLGVAEGGAPVPGSRRQSRPRRR